MGEWLHRSHLAAFFISLQEKHLHCLAKTLLIPKSYLTANHPNLYVNGSTQTLWWTHPNIFIALYELWMSKETSLQYGFCQCKVYHVQKKQSQNRQVYDDCNLHNANKVYARIVTLSHNLSAGSKDQKNSTCKAYDEPVNLWWCHQMT